MKAATTAQDPRKAPRDETQNIIIASRSQSTQETTRKAEERIRKLPGRQRKIKIEFFLCYAQSTAFAEFPQYYDCTTTIALQRALGNEVPKWDPEEGDWQLPIIIEQYHHAKLAPYLPVKRYFVDGPCVHHQAGLNQSGACSFPSITDPLVSFF